VTAKALKLERGRASSSGETEEMLRGRELCIGFRLQKPVALACFRRIGHGSD